jgi:hypothetical protein
MSAKRDITGLLRFAALLAWLLAAVVLAQAVRQSGSVQARLSTRMADLGAVAGFERKARALVRAEDAFFATYPTPSDPKKRTPPLDLAALAVQSLSGAATNSAREIKREALGRCTVVRVLVEAEQAPLAALSPLIESAETAYPPWRLVAATIEPDSPKAGKGRIRLEFETLLDNAKISPEHALEK